MASTVYLSNFRWPECSHEVSALSKPKVPERVCVLLKAGTHVEDMHRGQLFVAQQGFDSCWGKGRMVGGEMGTCESQNLTREIGGTEIVCPAASSQATDPGVK